MTLKLPGPSTEGYRSKGFQLKSILSALAKIWSVPWKFADAEETEGPTKGGADI